MHDTGGAPGRDSWWLHKRPQPWFSKPLCASALGHAGGEAQLGVASPGGCQDPHLELGVQHPSSACDAFATHKVTLQAPTQQRRWLRGCGELVLTLHCEVGCFC